MTKSDEADVAAGQAAKPTKQPITKRQRRKMSNDKHKWPQMPKIQSEEVRAKAYVRVAGLAEPKPVGFDLNDPSVRFGRLLGSADQRKRHQAVLQLEAYLKQKCEIRDEEDDEVSQLSGLSELDLLKLWKALWHTLYMADKVPVQHELSQKLAKLIWCVAGTEEEDEYAAQVYLDMYGDSDVGFDDDEDDDEEEEDGDDEDGEEDDDENDDEDSYTMEEIENTLREEIGEEDSAEEEDDDEMEEEEEMEEDEGLDDSEIPHCRGAHLAALFVRTFFRTVRREWGHMDKYRVDKFYSLTRMMMHQVLKYMSLRHWKTGIIRIFNDVLHEEVLSQTPNGLRYHLIDLTLEELALVNAKAPMPLTEATFLDCLEPYFAMASVDIGDDSVKARVMENIISKFLEDYSFVSPNPAKDEEGNPLTMNEVHVGTVAEQIFTLASDSDTPDKDREALYELHKHYLRAIKKAGKDVDLEAKGEESDEENMLLSMDCDDQKEQEEEESVVEESEEEKPKPKKKKKKGKKKDGENADDGSVEMDRLYDGDVDTPERPRKRKLLIEKEEKGAVVEAGDKKKKEKKRKKKHDIHADEEEEGDGKQPMADKTPDNAGKDEMATEEKESAKKKKKKKKKAKSSAVDGTSTDESGAQRNEITISVAEQKAALKAMKASTTPKEKTTSSKTSDQDESTFDRKKVKFGDKNMARSWKTSMKGLRTMPPISPLPKPEKGILHKRDAEAKAKKAKKVRQRKKATDYF